MRTELSFSFAGTCAVIHDWSEGWVIKRYKIVFHPSLQDRCKCLVEHRPSSSSVNRNTFVSSSRMFASNSILSAPSSFWNLSKCSTILLAQASCHFGDNHASCAQAFGLVRLQVADWCRRYAFTALYNSTFVVAKSMDQSDHICSPSSAASRIAASG